MGHAIKRKDDPRFLQGKGNYVEDVTLPGMVYGHMVRSPLAHARIKSINTEAAKKLPGVLAVITGEDLAKANLAWMPTLYFDKQMVLATGKVLFQSQEVAFVVAEDRYIAADPARRSRGKEQPYLPLGSWRQISNRQGVSKCCREGRRTCDLSALPSGAVGDLRVRR